MLDCIAQSLQNRFGRHNVSGSKLGLALGYIVEPFGEGTLGRIGHSQKKCRAQAYGKGSIYNFREFNPVLYLPLWPRGVFLL